MNVKVLSFVTFLGVVTTSSCVATSDYVLASDANSATTLAAQIDEGRIQNEKRDYPPEGHKTWRAYWKDRFLGLRRLAESDSPFAKGSLENIAYIKRRRAEEGLPPY